MKINIFFISIGLVLIFIAYVMIQFLVPLSLGNEYFEVAIPRGASFKQAVNILHDKGMLRDKNLFLVLGRITGLDRKLRAGYYSLWGTMNPYEIFKVLYGGSIIEYTITIVEGDSLAEIGQKLSEKSIGDADEFEELARDSGFLGVFNINAPSIEGYLFPETYKFPKGLALEEVLSMMVEKLREKYNAELMEKTISLGLNENKVLTLASIIEKEAATDDERPLISAVYHNRLRKRMNLQADPTAVYGIKSLKEKITKKDLMRKTAYNTYAIKGLPPGPIASPGLKSIIAALNPAEVPYLYFVSNNDGTHNFSETLKDHLAAVRLFREKTRAANQRP